jgi:hypothetical protein
MRLVLTSTQDEANEVMGNNEKICVLCRKAPRRRKGSLLCRDCVDTVSQVMPYEIYEANYSRDRQTQLEQLVVLVTAAKGWD